MAAKACINWIEPESSTTVRVGDPVNCRLAMYNCGDVLGNFYATISKNGVRCSPDSCFNVSLEPACEDICECNFTMPDKVITLAFVGGHAEGGVWKEDFSKTITLTPHAYCEQRFRVVDEEGVNIDIGTVNVYEGGSFWGHCTTVVGYCMVSDLEKGHVYKAVASKTGYDCLNCEETFTGCTSRITLSLKKKEVICNQPFKVEDTDGNIITKNCYIVVREGAAWRGECPTGSDGLCTVSGLIKGKYLKACIEQIPGGYEAIPESCQNFTACTTMRTLKLKKTPSTGILRVTSTPVQGADIYISDIKQPYKTNQDFTLEAGYYNVKAMLEGYKEPAMQGVTVVAGETKTLSFTLVPVAVACEYTGYASDAKIDHDDVPSSAPEGNEVTGSVSVDCIEVGETRYRVKFVLDGGSPAYSDSFLLGYVGEMDVLFTFTMPDHDVTVVAEVERCNASGEWGPCEHTDHIKTYTVTLALYEGPYGAIAEGYPKISNESCLDTCENENPCTADEGERPDFEVEYKNAGNEDGYFQAFLIGYNGIGIDAPDAPEGEGKVFDSEFHVLPTSFKLGPGESRTVTLTPKLLCGSMPDTNWDLGIKIARITSLGFFEEWNDTKSFKVCYKQVVDHYSLALNDLPDELHTGDKITFSGKLSHDAGGVVNNKLIEIMEKDIDPDDFIAKGTTNPDGSFAIPWTVKKVGGWLEGKTAELYARFKFDSKEVTSNTERVAIVGPSLTKALVYGGIAVAAFAGGSIAESVAGPKGKMIGVPVKLCALIPAGLCGYQTYLIAKDKVPEWLKG